MEGKVLVDGRWQNPASGDFIQVIDPSDGKEFSKIARAMPQMWILLLILLNLRWMVSWAG